MRSDIDDGRRRMTGELILRTTFSIADKEPFASSGTTPDSVTDDIMQYMNPDSGDNTVMYDGARVTLSMAYSGSNSGEIGNPQVADFELDSPMDAGLFREKIREQVTKLQEAFFTDAQNQGVGRSKKSIDRSGGGRYNPAS